MSCEICGRDTVQVNGCIPHSYHFESEGPVYEAIPCGEGDTRMSYDEMFETQKEDIEQELEQFRERWDREEFDSRPCEACGAEPGEYHHVGCDMESCPVCDGQLFSCEHTIEEIETPSGDNLILSERAEDVPPLQVDFPPAPTVEEDFNYDMFDTLLTEVVQTGQETGIDDKKLAKGLMFYANYLYREHFPDDFDSFDTFARHIEEFNQTELGDFTE